MDSLARYSSDDSSLDSDHVPTASSFHVESKKTDKSSGNLEKDSTHIAEKDPAISKVDAYLSGVPQPAILSYLQEYSMNAQRQTTAFLYLPWNPTKEIKARLRSAGSLAVHAMRTNVPNFDDRFLCNSTMNPKAATHGIFGLTNTRSMTNLHVSLFPNALVSQHKLRQFIDNIQRAVKQLLIPRELLILTEQSPLDRMLCNDKTSQTKLIRFNVDGNLYLYKLTKLGLLFLGMGLSKFRDKERMILSAQFHYLTLISRAIEDQANLMDLSFGWLQFNVPEKNCKGDLSKMYYHFSLIICELKPRGTRMNDAEFVETRDMIRAIDVSEVVQGVVFDMDHILLSTPDSSHRISLV